MGNLIEKSDKMFYDHGNKLMMLFVVLVAGLIFILWAYTRMHAPEAQVPAEVQTQVPVSNTDSEQFVFSCKNDKSITAVFSETQVRLALSDGRTLTIPQAVSGSGARYANQDESFVFWNKGNTAFIEESGTRTYRDCVTSQNN